MKKLKSSLNFGTDCRKWCSHQANKDFRWRPFYQNCLPVASGKSIFGWIEANPFVDDLQLLIGKQIPQLHTCRQFFGNFINVRGRALNLEPASRLNIPRKKIWNKFSALIVIGMFRTKSLSQNKLWAAKSPEKTAWIRTPHQAGLGKNLAWIIVYLVANNWKPPSAL